MSHEIIKQCERTFSARTVAPATVFRRFVLGAGFLSSSSSTASAIGFVGFLVRSAILELVRSGGGSDPEVGGVSIDCLSRRARVASAERSC